MMTNGDEPKIQLSKISDIVSKVLGQPGTPTIVEQALAEIAKLTSHHSGDTEEMSDLSQTENQTL